MGKIEAWLCNYCISMSTDEILEAMFQNYIFLVEILLFKLPEGCQVNWQNSRVINDFIFFISWV